MRAYRTEKERIPVRRVGGATEKGKPGRVSGGATGRALSRARAAARLSGSDPRRSSERERTSRSSGRRPYKETRPGPAAPRGLRRTSSVRPAERKRRKDEERPGGVGRGGGSHRSWRQVDQSATFLPPGFHRRRLGPILRRPDSHFVVVGFRSRNKRPPSVAIAASVRLSTPTSRDAVRGSPPESAPVDLESAYPRKS